MFIRKKKIAMATKKQLLSTYKKVEDAGRKLMFAAQDLSRIASDYLGYAVAFKPFFDAVSQTQMHITPLFYIYCIPACKLRPQAPVRNHRRCTQAPRP